MIQPDFLAVTGRCGGQHLPPRIAPQLLHQFGDRHRQTAGGTDPKSEVEGGRYTVMDGRQGARIMLCRLELQCELQKVRQREGAVLDHMP